MSVSRGLWRVAQFLVHLYLADVSIRRNLVTNRQHRNCTRSAVFSQALEAPYLECKYLIFLILCEAWGLRVENKKGAPKSAFRIKIPCASRLQIRIGMMM